MLGTKTLSEYDVHKDKLKALKREAILVAKNKAWCGFSILPALSTVIKRNINSVYPECNPAIRCIYHAKINSMCEPIQPDAYIMWSRAGNLDNRRDEPFQPNHFVPLLLPNLDDSMDDLMDEWMRNMEMVSSVMH